MDNYSMIVEDENDVRSLNKMFDDGWSLRDMCPLNPSVSASVSGTHSNKSEVKKMGRALVVLERM